MKPRVLFLSPQPFFQWRGSPIRVNYNLQALSDLGCEIDLVTLPFGEDVDIPGMNLHRVKGFKRVRDIPIGPSFWKLIFDFKIYLLARKLLRQHDYAVVHGVEDAGFIGYFLARRAKASLIYEKHSDPASYRKKGLRNLVMWAYSKVETFTVRRARAVITTGDGLARAVRKLSPNTPCTHIQDIPSSLTEADPDRVVELREELKQTPNECLVTYVGSFAVYQGIELLMEAVPETLRLNPNVRFLIIGGSDDEITTLKERLSSPQVTFLGKINPEELPCYLTASDILLSPRISGHNTPLKLLDYLKAGSAIVATDLEANRLLLDQQTAVFAAPAAPDFARAIADLSLDPVRRQHLAGQGRHLIDSTYNYRTYKTQLGEVYSPLLSLSTGSR
jgi:glycosyltransferase involved in cell wall biosynthesis